jgi:hypothetical protein
MFTQTSEVAQSLILSETHSNMEEKDAHPARLASSLRAELRPGHPRGDPSRTSALIALRSSRPAPGHQSRARSAGCDCRQTAGYQWVGATSSNPVLGSLRMRASRWPRAMTSWAVVGDRVIRERPRCSLDTSHFSATLISKSNERTTTSWLPSRRIDRPVRAVRAMGWGVAWVVAHRGRDR